MFGTGAQTQRDRQNANEVETRPMGPLPDPKENDYVIVYGSNNHLTFNQSPLRTGLQLGPVDPWAP